MGTLIIAVLCVSGIVGGWVGIWRAKASQEQLPEPHSEWRDRSLATFVSPVDVIDGNGRRLDRNVFEIEVFDDLVQIVFRLSIARFSPVRYFYPRWYLPRKSISSAALTREQFAWERHLRDAVAIEFTSRAGATMKVTVGLKNHSELCNELLYESP